MADEEHGVTKHQQEGAPVDVARIEQTNEQQCSKPNDDGTKEQSSIGIETLQCKHEVKERTVSPSVQTHNNDIPSNRQATPNHPNESSRKASGTPNLSLDHVGVQDSLPVEEHSSDRTSKNESTLLKHEDGTVPHQSRAIHTLCPTSASRSKHEPIKEELQPVHPSNQSETARQDLQTELVKKEHGIDCAVIEKYPQRHQDVSIEKPRQTYVPPQNEITENLDTIHTKNFMRGNPDPDMESGSYSEQLPTVSISGHNNKRTSNDKNVHQVQGDDTSLDRADRHHMESVEEVYMGEGSYINRNSTIRNKTGPSIQHDTVPMLPAPTSVDTEQWLSAGQPNSASPVRHQLDRHSDSRLPPKMSEHARRLRAIEEQRRQLEQMTLAIRRRGQPASSEFSCSPKITPHITSMNHRGYPRDHTPYEPYDQNKMRQLMTGYVPQQPYPSMDYMHPAPYSSSGYPIPSHPSLHSLTRNSWMSGPFPARGQPEAGYSMTQEPPVTEDVSSDDDEPLRTRVKRHPSVLSQTSSHEQLNSHEVQESEINSLALESKSKIATKRIDPDSESEHLTTGTEEISFTLPRYEVQRQPLAVNENLPSVKVSIPNLVREELLLSPDHAEQEVQLLLDLFLPAQQALVTPDPAPATALLNFHTIAVMVIEAYVQFEIGDIQGLGRGHWHNDHNQEDKDYERTRDSKDADTEEIFFAVVDRWRAGLESKKPALALIRGAQEFCDLALDVIYYIKQHGLLQPQPKVRQERSDKGMKRGPRKKNKEADQEALASSKTKEAAEGKPKGIKRSPEKDVNELQPRKKAKSGTMPKEKKKVTPGVTVVRRK